MKKRKRVSKILSFFTAVCMMLTLLSGVTIRSEAAQTTEYRILQEEDLEWIAEAREALRAIAKEQEILALVYRGSSLEIRETADPDSAVTARAFCGQTVNILDAEIVETQDRLTAWEKISFYVDGAEQTGYIERSYLACSDERFLNWENEYGMNPDAGYAVYAIDEPGETEEPGTIDGPGETADPADESGVSGDPEESGASDETGEPGESGASGETEEPEENGEPTEPQPSDIEQFPESYRAPLTALKAKYPQWIFVPMNTGLDWQTVINNEIGGGKSLVHKSLADCTKEGSYDGGSWYYASEEILKYYMDPRNALTEDAIFQFELLTYNETYHTEEAVSKFLENTFMNSAKKAPGTDMTYANIFWTVGAEEGRKVSPFHLAARVYQEQGKGTSPLISGTYTGRDQSLYGFYNYFNVGATGKSDEEYIVNGLTYAKKQGWSNAYLSILGGANTISTNYIKKGQDTLYLQKFNVNPGGAYALYTHQYMQNISAPTTEASKIRDLYKTTGSLDNTFVFRIPVFNNMPQTACEKPVSSTKAAILVPSGYDAAVWIDGVKMPSVRRNGREIVSIGNGSAKSAVVYRYTEAGVPAGMYVYTLNYVNNAYRVTEQPELTDLLSYHGFSIRITGKSGIRFKTGVSAELKNRLLTDGVNGYRLKEYGTLVMNNANREKYPMVLGGEKVLSGMSYGKDAAGQTLDKIYETVDGRQRFTSVLVGLPASQYKVEYAFRGYMVLEKDGAETVVYGPVVARSIYGLAERVLAMDMYPAGSDAEAFLKKLITDATP